MQKTLYLTWLIIGLIIAAIVIIPFLCFFLYKSRKLRTCIIFSHLWCMIAFCLLGMFFLHAVRRYYSERQYADRAGKLLKICKMLREGDTQNTIMHLDEFLAGILYRTASDVPNDKMGEQVPDILWVWQEVKEYYDTYKIEEGGMIPYVRRKLAYVPWSDMQLAIKKFEQTYQSGKQALAPAINMESWLGRSLSSEELKDKVILLDFWNIRCSPCIKSLPELQAIYDTYKDRGLVVIACAGGDKKKTKEFLDKHGYHFPAGMFSYQMCLDYAVRGNPSYFLIDRDGYLVWGPEHRLPTGDELTNLLEIK